MKGQNENDTVLESQLQEEPDDEQNSVLLQPTSSSGGGGRHGARNNQKMKLFIKWLQQHFPKALGCDGDDDDHHQDGCCGPILDVAGGGKGELAVRLAWCNQRRVVIVDPRPTNVVECLQKHVLPHLPKKWQCRALQQAEEAKQRGKSPFRNLQDMIQQHQMYFTNESTLPGGLINNANSDLVASIQSASLLVGMHADSATEAIVDAALHYQKPFVVVPCCVFPNLFPHRTILLPDQKKENDVVTTTCTDQPRRKQVRSYDDFCEYILQKDARFQYSTLPFPGRNLAIWWDGC